MPLLILLSLATSAAAQATRVELSGIVRDSSGLPVAAASVTIRNTDTSLSAATMTDPSGIYRFVALLPGNYELR
jgi:protocatechuate 3,4-dioxygenase beta subunit